MQKLWCNSRVSLPRRLRRLKDETAECKYRGSRRCNPCVNSSDSTRKKSTTPLRAGYVWNSIDIVVVRDTKGCFNEFIRSEGKRSPQEQVEKVIGGGHRLTGRKIREELEILSIRCFECRREEFSSHARLKMIKVTPWIERCIA